jgi:hypothetical protein
MSEDGYNERGAGALAQLLSDVLGEPSRRKAFRRDPQAAAQAAGIDISGIPESVVGMLADLSGAELRLLSEVNHELVEAGLKVNVGGDTGGDAEGVAFSVARTLGVL